MQAHKPPPPPPPQDGPASLRRRQRRSGPESESRSAAAAPSGQGCAKAQKPAHGGKPDRRGPPPQPKQADNGHRRPPPPRQPPSTINKGGKVSRPPPKQTTSSSTSGHDQDGTLSRDEFAARMPPRPRYHSPPVTGTNCSTTGPQRRGDHPRKKRIPASNNWRRYKPAQGARNPRKPSKCILVGVATRRRARRLASAAAADLFRPCYCPWRLPMAAWPAMSVVRLGFRLSGGPGGGPAFRHEQALGLCAPSSP